MAVSDKLHIVIHSLTMNEKRYFKQFAAQQGESSGKEYLKLFDLVEKQIAYDEDKILKQLKYSKQGYKLSVLKNYLLKTIIKSMEMFHENRTVTRRVNSLLDEIEFYYSKGLMSLWEKSILKAEKFAVKYQLYPELIRIHWWRRRYQFLMSQFNEIPSGLKKSNGYLALLQSEFRYEKIYAELLHGVNLEYGSEEQSKRYESVIEDPIILNPNRALSIESKVKYHEILTIYSNMKQHGEESLKHAAAAVELAESYPDMIKAGGIRYGFPLLTNLMITQLIVRDFEGFKVTIEKLKQELDRPKVYGQRALTSMQFLAYSHETFYFLRVGEFEKAAEASHKLWENIDIDNLPEAVDRPALVVTLFNVAATHFGLGNYKEALNWVNRIINSKEFESVRPDVYSGAKIFFLILHYELGNEELLIYAFRSTYRYLIKSQSLQKFESTVLSHLKKLPKMNSQEELRNLFKDLKESLLEIAEDPYVYQALNAYRIISWLDSKITGRAYAEIVAEKVNREEEF